ncbi:Acg family FMN-binding oxidoreductase [Streptomyces noursei]|uniref:Acg family FMN-binding oxidoreductase n=1 Tax=Streptomyces noursei TaxID=1971 RepID=UPI0016744079|nr:nitroreductase [Streptomyces noursei]MCZ1012854.1 nitroreductase [Streptomyces noursei]GGX20512.1 nitroreductase [Streptomyces noursei]
MLTHPTLDDTAVKSLVADATTAPSMHNAQPWRFEYARASRTMLLSADLDRAMPLADPTTRGLHLGCGAALLNLRAAAAHAGHRTVTTLLPAPHTPTLLASVRLDVPHEPLDVALSSLQPAIAVRHTSRHPFSERRIADSLRAALVEAAAREGARLAFLTTPHREAVLDLILHAEGYNRMDDGREVEQRRWTHDGSAEAPAEGIPEYAFGPARRSGAAPVRDFAGRRAVPGRDYADFEKQPQLASLSTTHDEPADWLRAGQALERVLLLATRQGLASSFATQALEWPDLRWLLRDPLSGSGHVQMILRLGYGPDGPSTPRRPVDEVLTLTP